MHVAASTMRNMFVSYRGGSYSRAGTAFVGYSKQTGRSYPPRMLPFQFSINQGLALEFGNNYMRVISDGAFVTEQPVGITNITQSSPAVITVASTGATAGTPITTGVTSTYGIGEQITLAGGVDTSPAVLQVANTKLVALTVNSSGTGVFAPSDTLTLTGGTQTTPVTLTVNTTKVVSAAIAAGGAGGTPGTATVTGTTGTGTKFQAVVTISGGGSIVAILSISVGGSYTVNPALVTAEPVTGGGLAGATLNLKLGIDTFAIFNAGVFTVNPPSGSFIQNTTSGSGTGATFQFAVLGPHAVTVSSPGVYSVVPANPVAQASSSGSGLGATFTMSFGSAQAFNAGDWVTIAGVAGMTQINGQTYVVTPLTMSTFALYDVFGNPINSTVFGAYVSGGTAARIYTLATVYAETDLPYLKVTQSNDVMSICCVNQETLAEYQPQDLSRLADDSWSFAPVVPAPTVQPPSSCTGSASSAGSTNYQYVVTAVDPKTGTESVASPIATISGAVNIAATAGTITVTWSPVPGVTQYNVYKSTVTFGANPPVGTEFGFAGTAFGSQFTDSNIVADFTQVPPLAKNPFAQGQIVSATATAGGSGYSTATATVTTATGSGSVIVPVIVNGVVVSYIVENGGQNYLPTDTLAVSGDGTGAMGSVQVGPATGTYPGTPAYDQERRAYAYTLNQPDTYFFSQPGSFTNFDSRIPTIDSDAIIGSPWSTQVNGIQWLVPMPGGMVVLTGREAWQLTGTGGSSLNPQPLTPTTQQAQPQAFNGADEKVPPIRIDSHIVYVQAKGSIYRDLGYQYYLNIYTGKDLTVNSGQLFVNFQTIEHAWCEEPYKVIWSVRNDGALLSLTYIIDEQIAGWARHDTNGLFNSVCSVTEPPVDALYAAVQRFPAGRTAYMIERMDNRLWSTVEDTWCVDAGLEYPQPEPSASISISSATGIGSLSGVTGLVGGSGYSPATTARIVDNMGIGPGTGAVVALTIVAGVITAVAFTNAGGGYTAPALVIEDPAGSDGGSGASATVTLNDTATITSPSSVFSGSSGSVIRAAGGRATVIAVVSPMQVTVQITIPFTATLPNSGGFIPPIAAGDWTMTAPISTVTGLNHLAGATVTGLADGSVILPVVVSAEGTIPLSVPASAIIVGLGFTAQLQSVYLDPGTSPTSQGRRKKIAAVTCRVEASGGFTIGTNQPDGSTLSPAQLAPAWTNLTPAPTHGMPNFGNTVTPLFTGDVRLTTPGGFNTKGQAAVEQSNPQPLQVLSFISEVVDGDTPETKVPQAGGNRGNVQPQ